MTTYSLIVNNIIRTNNNFFSKNYDKTDNVDLINKSFFHILSTSKITTRSKFKFFIDTLRSALLADKRKEFIEYFCNIQKTYNCLNKFVYNYKYKKSKIVVNTDMGLNEIGIHDKNVMCIFNTDSRYLFHINDLINIINTSLTNSHLFFAEPLCIKNPYNNLPFNKSTLYNIYFFIKYKTFHSPELFFRFFNCNFNLTQFTKNNEYILRDYSIQNYVYKSSSNILLDEIKDMFDDFNLYCKKKRFKNKIEVDNDFPKEKLIKIMQPYLLLYITSQYAFLSHKKTEADFILKKKLLDFNNYNRQFGRKKYKLIMNYTSDLKKRITGKITEFDENHIQFEDVSLKTTNFFTEHLEYDDRLYIDNRIISYINYRFNFNMNIEDEPEPEPITQQDEEDENIEEEQHIGEEEPLYDESDEYDDENIVEETVNEGEISSEEYTDYYDDSDSIS